MDRKRVSISVVIPFHEQEPLPGDRPIHLARVLAALNRTFPRPMEVICVDDNSPAPCEPLIRGHEAIYLHTTAPPEEPHVARRALARQLGLAAARHDVVLFLDADVLVPANLMGKVLEAIRRDGPRSLVFVPRRDVFEGETRPLTKRGQPSVAYMASAVGGFRQPFWARQTSHCFAAARQFVQAAGGWDVNFVGWGEEDTELFYRLWTMGGKIVTPRNLTVGHLAHPVDHEANHDSFARNARYFMEKHPAAAWARRAFYRHLGLLQEGSPPRKLFVHSPSRSSQTG